MSSNTITYNYRTLNGYPNVNYTKKKYTPSVPIKFVQKFWAQRLRNCVEYRLNESKRIGKRKKKKAGERVK